MRALVIGLALIAPGMALSTQSASASTKPEVVVKEGAPIVKTYPALVGQGQANEQVNFPTPDECSKPPGETYCDAIPVRVQLPRDYDPDSDEFLTKVSLAWDDTAGTDDMELIIYDVHNVMTGKSTTDPTADPGAPAKNPETSASADERFTVVVDNAQGPNNGYTLKFTFVRKRFTPVTEKPSNFSGGGASNAGSNTQTTTKSFTAPLTTTPPPIYYGPTTVPLDLPPLDLTDPDFAAGAGTDLTSGLFRGPATPAAQSTPAKPVSAGVLIAMLGVLPFAAVGAGGVFFRRRATRLLEF